MDPYSHSRRAFGKRTLGFAWLSFFPFLGFRTAGKDDLQSLMKAAGNADSESKCLEYLQTALKLPSLSPEDRNHLGQIVAIVDQWTNGKEKFEQASKKPKRYLASFITRDSRPGNWVLPKLPENHIMYPLFAWYRARLLAHNLLQHGDIQGVPEVRERYLVEIKALLSVAHAAFPKNKHIAMYLGEAIPWKTNYPHSIAPKWAQSQRETLEKLREILHWWVDERQVSDGQYGGGWGDDVEMWRKWIPLLVGFEDPKLINAQEKLSNGLFAAEHMAGGYTNKITDVEHTAEDSADTCTAMMHVRPLDPTWKKRALRLIELMKSLWTGRNARGQLQFKSTYFTSDEVDETPRKACDTVYHPRAIQPALLEWQRSGNKETGDIVLDWMDTWVAASAREEKGKPKGIIPSAIHWPDGTVGGIREEWWRPGNYTSNPLYVWPSAMRMMVNTLLLSFHMSKNRKYLTPIFSMAKIYRKYLQGEFQEDSMKEGSEAWCASRMQRFMPGVLAKYRKLSGDRQFDDILLQSGNGYSHMLMRDSRVPLEKELEQQTAVFSRDKVAFTHDVRWTDRVFRFHGGFINHFIQPPLPTYDPGLLFSCVTGNVGDAMYFPLNAVRWLTEAIDIAILITEAKTDSLKAELFHFGNNPREMGVEVFLLKPGHYTIHLRSLSTQQTLLSKDLHFQKPNPSIHFSLPSNVLCELNIVPSSR